MNTDGDMSSGFNQLGVGGPYQFISQAAVNQAAVSGQNIDWAQLAQQWIQMRDNPKTTATIKEIDPLNVNVIKYEEKGEADMDMDDEEQTDDKDNGVNNRRDSTSAIMLQPANTTNTQHWFMDKKSTPVDTETEVGINSQRSNHWSKWPNNQNIPKTSCQSNVTKRQINSTAHIPSLLKINVPHPNEIRALPDDAGEQSSSSNLMDAAKRKGLPAWIREGLEKMEREKQKQQEKQTTTDQCDLSDDGAPMSSRKATVNSLNLKQLENDHEDSTGIELAVGEVSGSRVNESFINDEISEEEVGATEKNGKSYEQKLAELMVVVRHTLTELLLEVTNEEISKIANETVKSYKLKASSAQVIHNSALSSITGKLGLAVYGDSSSDEFSEDADDENNSKRKTFLSESGNDSEEDIKIAVRLKRRSFVKIANEIEERVSAAAVREEEKIKYFLRKEEAEAIAKKCKNTEKDIGSEKREMVTNESVSAQLSSGCSDKNIGKNYERDSGETTETKLQIINGKRQRDRGALKERTTRFSDNRDNRYLAIAATVTCITDTQSKGNISSNTITQLATNQSQTTYNVNCLLPSYNCPGIANTLKAKESEVEVVSKHKTLSNPENEVDYKRYKYAKRKRQHQGDSKVSPARSPSRSSSSSSSSSSSTSESSTSESSDNSKYSHRSVSKHSSQMSTKISRRSQKDKCDDRKYHSSYDKKSRTSSYTRYRRDRSHSRHHRHESSDSDDTYSRRKHGSRYSSSHSRSHNSSRNHRDFSRSNSRSSYSSSSKRRH